MDFIDYQVFSVEDTSTGGEAALPEPSSSLNLSTFAADFQNDKDNFKLPNLIEHKVVEQNDQKANLYERMAQYAILSIDTLSNSAPISSSVPNHLPNTSQFTQPTKATLKRSDTTKTFTDKKTSTSDVTDLVLSKKLSKILNDYILTNYQSRTQLRKSLQLLEENKEKLTLDEAKLIQPGYIGTLARKTLRSDLENALLKEHLSVLEEFRPIVRRIKRLSTSVENIRTIGVSVLEEYEGKEEKTAEQAVTDNVNQLRTEMKALLLKKRLLVSLQEQFTLTQVEDDFIVNGSIDPNFFDIVNKSMKIKERATLLLALPNSKAGSSLINKINQTLELVNRKIYNYLVDFLYNYESNSNSFIGKSFTADDTGLFIFQKCLIYLSNDLTFFNEFLKRVTTVRSKIVLDEFLSQFDLKPTESRPIVLSAHDPLRYIGDVLANVHASIANEADFVKSLFKFQDEHIDNPPIFILEQNREFLRGLDDKLLNETVQSLSNSCRIRIEQIIKFEENPVTNLEIVRLLNLYHLMFERKGINEDSTILNNLKLLENVSKKKIEEYFDKYIQNLSPEDSVSNDLLPPEWLSEYINEVVELLEVYEKGKNSESSDDTSLIDFKFLQKVVEEPVQNILLKRLQASFPRAKKNEKSTSSLLTVQINCFDLVKSRLEPFSTTTFSQDDQTAGILINIEDKLNGFVSRMVELQKKTLLENTGLSLYYNLFNMIFPVASVQDELDYDMYLSLCENSLMALETINNNVNKKLNEYIPKALTDVQGNFLFKLTSPTIADHICDNSLATLSDFYILFRRVLVHLYPERKEDIAHILNFSEEEFKTLIGI